VDGGFDPPPPSGGGSLCPSSPASAPSPGTLQANIDRASEINGYLIGLVASGVISAGAADAFRLAWLTAEVAPHMEMDYKQQDPSFREFGNFNFGAVGAALGLDPGTLFYGAGAASQLNFNLHNVVELLLQAATGNVYQARLILPPVQFGSPATGPPYGDSPLEQFEIAQGIRYFLGGCKN